MFPYRDENPTELTPIVTIGIIVANLAVWLLVQGAGTSPALARSVCELGLVPGDLLGRLPEGTQFRVGPQSVCVITSGVPWYTVFTSMFMHGGWFHLIGNMWFLWIFGNNIEDSMGHTRFAVFYLVVGVVAAVAQIASGPSSAVPMVGASGAVSGVMGAYLILYPRVRIHTLIFFGLIFTVAVPAYLMLLYWFLLQLLGGLPAIGGAQEGGVAFAAHLGGFIAGVALIKLFTNPELVAKHTRPRVEVGTWR